MAPVIWGLDLDEIQLNKFKNSYMWKNTDYHVRRRKFVVYQLAMILCVVSESLGTAALSDYNKEQKDFARRYPGGTIHNNDYIGVASYNIFVGVFIATIFGAGFFFELFFPARHESQAVKWAWRICAILCPVFVLSSAIAMTYVLAVHKAYITGLTLEQERNASLDKFSKTSPLEYHKNARAVASVVLIWLGLPFTFWSAILLWQSYAHNDQLGPWSTHKRTELEQEKKLSNAGTHGTTGTVDGVQYPQPVVTV